MLSICSGCSYCTSSIALQFILSINICLQGFLEKVNSVEELVTVGWIIVDMKPIKHCLQSLVLKWKNKFTSHIIDRVS